MTGALEEFADLRLDAADVVPERGDPRAVRYLDYQLSVRDHGDPAWRTIVKSVRLLRIIRMPVVPPALRRRTSEYDDQRDLVRALWAQRIHYLCLLGDSGPEGLGVLNLMGVQGVGATIEEARAQADRHFAALSAQLVGAYPQIRTRALTPPEADWLLQKQQQWVHVLPVRGIPMPRRDVGEDLRMPLAGHRQSGGEIEEGVEELVRGMLGGQGYLLVLMASPISLDQVTTRLSAAAEQLSTIASQIHGQRSVSAGVGVPLMFSTATGDPAGTAHSFGVNTGSTDTASTTHGSTATTTDGVSQAVTDTRGVTSTDGTSVTDTRGATEGRTHSQGLSGGQSETEGVSTQQTHGTTKGVSTGTSDQISHSQTSTTGQAHQVSQGTSAGLSSTASDSSSLGTNSSVGETSGRTVGGSESRTRNWSEGTNEQFSASTTATHGENSNRSLGGSLILNLGTSSGTSDQLSHQSSQSHGTTTSVGGSHGVTASESESRGTSSSHGVNSSHTTGVSQSANQGWNAGVADTVSQQFGNTVGRTQGVTTGQSLSTSDSTSTGQNASVGTNRGWTEGTAQNTGTQQSSAVGRSQSVAHQESTSHQTGRTHSIANGVSDTTGRSLGETYGRSDALSQSNARNSQLGGSLSFVPTVGLSASRQTLDAMADQVGKIYTALVHRLSLGLEEGMWLSHGYMLVPDEDTGAAAAGLLTSSFWGTGEKAPIPQPFCVSTTLTPAQSEHLLLHARAFSPCAHADRRPQVIEPHYYGTALLSNEVAVLTTPPRIDVPGIVAAAAGRLPALVFPQARNGQIRLGHVVDTQRGMVSSEEFSLIVDDQHNDMLHPLVTGSTGRGKTESGLRLAHEWLHTTQSLRTIDPATGLPTTRQVPRGVLALDRKSDWRRLAHSLPTEESDRFRFYDLSCEPPQGHRCTGAGPYLRYNLLRIPPGVRANVFRDAICDTMAKVGALGPRGRGILWQALHALWSSPRPDPVHGDTATVYERPELSRFIGMPDLAEWVDTHLQAISRKSTTSKELITGLNIIQNRLQFFHRDVYGSGIYLADTPGSTTSDTIEISDLVGQGHCVVLEAAHLDAQSGALVLAAIFTAAFAYARDNVGSLSETLVILEEANDYLPNEREDVSGVTQTVFDQTLAMGRHLRLSLMLLVQSPERLSQQAINCAGLVVIHSADSYESKQRMMAKISRDGRYDHRDLAQFLGDVPTGWAVLRPRPTRDWIDGAPVLVAIDAVDLPQPSDDELGLLA